MHVAASPVRPVTLLLACALSLAPLGCGGASGAGEPPPVPSGGSSGGAGTVTTPDDMDRPTDEAEPADEARASWTEETFELTGTATGPFAVGTASSFEIRLTPRGEYHVNREYPWSVTVTPPAAVTVPTTTFDAGTATEMTDTVARFVVPFTPTAAGTHDVTAAVDFGVCREEACVFEMRNVLVQVVAAEGAVVPGAVVPGAPAGAAAPAEGTAPAGAVAPGAVVPGLEGVGATSALDLGAGGGLS